MINWYVKFEGQRKRFDDIVSPDLRAMMEPLQAFLAGRLAPLADDNIDVVFKWAIDGSLGFTLASTQLNIAEAISLIGERAEFHGLDS